MKVSKLEFLVAVNGGTVLVLEIIGSRIMAPFFGTSIYVWTAIIGVILFSLSIGYWYGGKIADKHASMKGLSLIFVFTAALLSVELIFQPYVLQYLFETGLPLRVSALLGALAVYTVPTIFMGFVSPYISKLSITSLKHSGETIGRLYAAGTVGSIIGTFLAGYWLTGSFSNEIINGSIVVIYVVLAIYTYPKLFKIKSVVLILLASLVLTWFSVTPGVEANVLFQKDTPYARYQVLESTYQNKPARLLVTDKLSIQSAQYIEDPSQPTLAYIEPFLKIADSIQSVENILIIGGGAYSLPQFLADRYPQSKIDVVEIDGELLAIAETYFNYAMSENTTNYVEDGRIFLNNVQSKKYDLIYFDAFSSYNPPFHLSTIESFQAAKNSLTEDGIVAINVIGSENGPRNKYTAAVTKTFAEVFISTKIFATNEDTVDVLQNIILVGSKTSNSSDFGLNYLSPISPSSDAVIFTDSYTPVEKLL